MSVKYTASKRWSAVSTRFDNLDEVEQKKLKNEQWAVRYISLSVLTFLYSSHFNDT